MSPQSAHGADTKRRRLSLPSSPVQERSTKQTLMTDGQPEGLQRHPDNTRMGKEATQLLQELTKLGHTLDHNAMRRLGLHVDKAQVRYQALLIWRTTDIGNCTDYAMCFMIASTCSNMLTS